MAELIDPNPNNPDLETLFHELDEGLAVKLDEVKTELAQIEPPPLLESMALSADYLKEGAGKEGAESTEALSATIEIVDEPESKSIRPEGSFILATLSFISLTVALPFLVLASVIFYVIQERKKPKEELNKGLSLVVAERIKTWKASSQKLSSFLKGINYSRLFMSAVLIFAIGYIVHDIRKNLKFSDKSKDPFLSGFEAVADSVKDVQVSDEREDSESVLEHPEFTVKLPRIISNLKAMTERASPMVTTELYVEASNQEAAVEIRDREEEVRDSIERVLEESTFDALDTAPGKEELKVHLRESINQVLTRGRVKRIYFNTLNIAP